MADPSSTANSRARDSKNLDPQALDPKLLGAVEALQYRVSVGDVAAQAGLPVAVAEQGLLALASAVGGNLEVAESGDIAYGFPNNFRAILLGRFWKLRLRAGLGRAWKICFYLIRISFGLALFASIGVLAIALIILALAAIAAVNRDDDNNSFDPSGLFSVLFEVLGSALRLFFYADWLGGYGYGNSYGNSYARGSRSGSRNRKAASPQSKSELNLLEAIFSFLFGDGNPNGDLDDRRWQAIAQVIRQQRGAIAAEQAMPYLDSAAADPDDAILPVLVQFQGRPQVSPQGEIVYQFPELQITAGSEPSTRASGSAYLQENPWKFSQASPTQRWAAGLLGLVNIGLAVLVGSLLPQLAATGIGFLGFVSQIYPLLLLYGLGFLVIPLVRWQVVGWRDRAVQRRNQQRQQLASQLQSPSPELRSKLAYAKQFAQQTQLKAEEAAYTTDQDLLDQEIAQSAKEDDAWQRRLDGL